MLVRKKGRKMRKSFFRLVLVITLLFTGSLTIQAHPGRTDSKGGHTCRTNCPDWGLKYGEYHLHNSFGYYNSENEFFTNDGKPWFSDVPLTHWAYQDIKNLYDEKIIKGYKGSIFLPNASIRRDESMKMIVTSLGVSYSGYHSNFSDVKKGSWAYEFISYANSNNIIKGYEDGTFKPGHPITRAEMATILSNTFKFQVGSSSLSFKDINDTHWAYNAIQLLSSNGIIRGYKDNTFKPNYPITRAEFSAMLSRILK